MATSGDPIGRGFVKSLAKPGGNITGLSNQSRDVTAKSLELLHVVIPKAKRIAVLMSPNASHQTMVTEAYAAAGALGLTIVPVMARTPADLDDAFANMRKENCEALVVLADARITRKIVELANQWRLPAVYQFAEFVDMGGWLSYGADLHHSFGRPPSTSTRYSRAPVRRTCLWNSRQSLSLRINLKTTKVLGLTIPDSILARADKVIE